jgi:hypothetical protein
MCAEFAVAMRTRLAKPEANLALFKRKSSLVLREELHNAKPTREIRLSGQFFLHVVQQEMRELVHKIRVASQFEPEVVWCQGQSVGAIFARFEKCILAHRL